MNRRFEFGGRRDEIAKVVYDVFVCDLVFGKNWNDFGVWD